MRLFLQVLEKLQCGFRCCYWSHTGVQRIAEALTAESGQEGACPFGLLLSAALLQGATGRRNAVSRARPSLTGQSAGCRVWSWEVGA